MPRVKKLSVATAMLARWLEWAEMLGDQRPDLLPEWLNEAEDLQRRLLTRLLR